jgi:fatty acid desaturase
MDTSSDIAFGRDKVITRKELKPFMKRTNKEGLINFIGHMAIMVITGYLLYLSLNTWWVIPTMAAHAVVLAFFFAPVHECSHNTVFRSRALNETVYWIVCLIYIVPPTIFRYDHATHHTYTQIRGKDTAMVLPEKATLWDYFYYLTGIPFWMRGVSWFTSHAFGRVHQEHEHVLPESEHPRVIREARLFILLYLCIAAVAFYFQSWAPLTFWIIPRLVGEPFMRWLRIAEHAECEEGGDLTNNTRSTKASSLINFLFWNMPYHAEHHICPMVPFHALPDLHEKIKHQLYPTASGYMSVHAEVISKLAQKEGVTWQ